MKLITNVEVQIVEGELVIEGQRIDGLFVEAKEEPNIREHVQITSNLPAEDLLPGHVFPAVAFTTSRAS